MRNLFSKIEVSSSCDLGKKDKKNINKELQMEILEKNEEYKVHKCKNKTKLITRGDSGVLFYFNKKYFPTIKYLEKHDTKFSEIYLDDGAVIPINRGADVMIPGISKYRDMVKGEFRAGDPIVVRIIGQSIIGVGEALMDFKGMDFSKSGAGVEIYHKVGDGLYNEDFQ